MSSPDQKTTHTDSMDTGTPKEIRPSEAGVADPWDGPPRSERLRTIRDLVRSNNYQVSAGLVAERMVEQFLNGRRGAR